MDPWLVDTPSGPARLHPDVPAAPRALLVLGHGAGGSITAPDLVVATSTCVAVGIAVVRVEQPYRVAGRRSPAPAARLDEAWLLAVRSAAQVVGEALPIVTGGRSSGARVAARTSDATGASAVLALAFPLITPRGVSRQAELDAVDVPMLIIAGDRDPFGVPQESARRRVHVLAGADHSLKGHIVELRTVLSTWLADLLPHG